MIACGVTMSTDFAMYFMCNILEYVNRLCSSEF